MERLERDIVTKSNFIICDLKIVYKIRVFQLRIECVKSLYSAELQASLITIHSNFEIFLRRTRQLKPAWID